MTAPQRNPTVLMFGEVNPDIVVTAVPDLTFGQREDLTGRTTMTVGSSVAITACGLARLGTPTGLVGVIGDDAFGAFMLQRLRDRQVLVDRVRTVAGGRTGSSVILVRRGDNNDRHILTDRGVMGDLRADDLDLQQSSGVRGTSTSARGSSRPEPSRSLPDALAEAEEARDLDLDRPERRPRSGVGLPAAGSAAPRRLLLLQRVRGNGRRTSPWAAVNRPPPTRPPGGSSPTCHPEASSSSSAATGARTRSTPGPLSTSPHRR